MCERIDPSPGEYRKEILIGLAEQVAVEQEIFASTIFAF